MTTANPTQHPVASPPESSLPRLHGRATKFERLWSKARFGRWAAIAGGLIVLVAVTRRLPFLAPAASPEISATVLRDTLPIIVTAGGQLESVDGTKVFCEVEGQQVKIVEMIPEGTQVKKGDLVMRLDPSEVNQRLAEQQIKVTQVEATAKATAEELKIQTNLAESRNAQAQLALTLAKLDKEKYIEGDYTVELNGLRGSIALAQTELQEAEDTLSYYRMLVKKGFRTSEQLRAKEQAVQRAKFNLSRDTESLKVLEKYTRKRQMAELTSKAEEAKHEVERTRSSGAAAVIKAQTDLEVAEATARLQRELLERIESQLSNCDVRAPCAGTVFYAHEKNKPMILGSLTYFKKKLFEVTDLSRMRVKAFVHESEVRKLRVGMEAEIRVEALPDLVLRGQVEEMANTYDSTRHWLSGGVKDYDTLIGLDQQLADAAMRPGMTTQIQIYVGELSDALLIPIHAVAERDGHHYCYLIMQDEITRRQVSLGESTETFVEVLRGVSEGDRVSLDARNRLAAEMSLEPDMDAENEPALVAAQR